LPFDKLLSGNAIDAGYDAADISRDTRERRTGEAGVYHDGIADFEPYGASSSDRGT
jgi:hypothetical protein